VHPGLAPALAGRTPIAVQQVVWPGGVALEIGCYAGDAQLPDELVSSIRCLVTNGDRVLVCADAGSEAHVLPGGRREPGESWAETAIREVHEETGWTVEPTSVRVLGFLHIRHLETVPEGHSFPHPDFLQIVLHAEGTPGPEDWVDTDPRDFFVTRSWSAALRNIDDLPLAAGDRAFLGLLP
jgi:8-oxo-dGTP pyrophosphatase MutT (NUDIX family)